MTMKISLISEPQRQLKPPKKRAENPKADTIVHEHITRFGRITSFKLPRRLQRDVTQIRKTRQQVEELS